MIRLPRGTVTFLCARLDPATPGQGADLLRTTLAAHDGVLFHDDGTLLYAAFSATLPALHAALAIQREFVPAAAELPATGGPAIALHTGPTHERNGLYFGPTLNRAISMLAAAHPGQILLSSSAHEVLQKFSVTMVENEYLGEYRLKDLYRTAQLYQVLAPDLPRDFPPLHTLDTRPHNLPIQDSPLIGRDQEVATACAMLRDPETRLVTLLGSSGMGKTRLAMQVAVEVIDNFRDGVWFVALAPINDPDLLVPAIAQVLGVREQPDQPLITTLTSFLEAKQLLLVLDNFEQIWAAAPTITEILASCLEVKVLVTTQVMLELEHEHVFGLPPLAMPDPSERLSLADLGQIPAVALFVERAREVQPTFTLTELMAPAIIELCTHLEGVPLAIGLVATQIKRYFPSDMLLMLQNRLSVARTFRRGNTREDTLRPVLDWICEGLGPDISTLFARLGVFAGGCTAESASAVCNATNDLALDVEETLGVLLTNHLLLREELKEDHVRYTMLDAIHDYAQQRLKKRREGPQLARTHADYYTTLAETASPLLRTAEQKQWLSRLQDEYHNLRAALSWGVSHEVGLALRLSVALTMFWFAQSHIREARRWLEVALEHTQAEPAQRRALALNSLGVFAYIQGDYDLAVSAYEEALVLQRELGNTAVVGSLLTNLGIIALYRGNYAEAAALFEEALPLQRAGGAIQEVATTLNNLGVLMTEQGNLEQAEAYLQECLTLREEAGDNSARGNVLLNLGVVAYHGGELERAEHLLSQSLTLAREIDDELTQAEVFETQALIRLMQGDKGAAREVLQACARIRQEKGAKSVLASTLEATAALLVAEGQPEQAAMSLGRAAALRTTLSTPPSVVQQRLLERTHSSIVDQLGEDAFHTAWQRGAAISVEELFSQTLGVSV